MVDSSSLISLAWAGQLGLLRKVPLDLVIPDVVRAEAVTAGMAGGYSDATAIESAIGALQTLATKQAGTVDQQVLAAARDVGRLVTNDLALGRRAANLGADWLRTADLVILCVRVGSVESDEGRAVLTALHAAGRLSPSLHASYLKEIP